VEILAETIGFADKAVLSGALSRSSARVRAWGRVHVGGRLARLGAGCAGGPVPVGFGLRYLRFVLNRVAGNRPRKTCAMCLTLTAARDGEQETTYACNRLLLLAGGY